MLNIVFNQKENTVVAIDSYFKFVYEEEWFNDPLVKQMVLDVDKSEVVAPNCISSPVFGQISPNDISGGVKALILMLKRPDMIQWATNCGDNCSKWIIEISKIQDITISLSHIMIFPYDFEGYCLNNQREIHCINDYRECVAECL